MVMIKFISKLVLLILMILIDNVLSKQVSVYDKRVDQLVTSSLLSWEAFDANNPRQFDHAVIGGQFLENRPAYICRSTINSVAVTGFVTTRSENTHVCIISQHSQIKTKQEFELLMNKGNGAKIEWHYWDKSDVVFKNIDGTVSTINGGSRSEVYYIARHKRNHSMEGHEIDHAIGWFNPTEGFGKIHAIVASHEESFDNGEILTTFEPVKYELHDIKFKSQKLRISRNRTWLGQTMLKNEDEKLIDVNSVIGYGYDLLRYFGHHEGIARSVNTTVYVQKKEVYTFFWGIQQNEHILKTKGIGTELQPGTALNVTLWGNYTRKEGPYDAQLVIHWSDGSKSNKRRITVANGIESDLEEQLEIEYSPTFWLHNNTVVPTTTQRITTSTSSSSTTHRSIFSTSMSSNFIEKITEKTSMNIIDSSEEDEENEVNGTSSNPSSVHLKSYFVMLVIMNLILLITPH